MRTVGTRYQTDRDPVTWIALAVIVIAVLVGSTIEVPTGAEGQRVNDAATSDLIRYEDGSWSDGFCEAGALCDDTAVTR